VRGGHRLWVSPEDPRRTYVPDNGPVAWRRVPGGARLTPPPDARFGLEKSIAIVLDPSGTRVTVSHRIRNRARRATRLAAWALSVMAAGGTAAIPLAQAAPHPPPERATAADFGPKEALVLWPYFSFHDARWIFGDRYLRVRHDPGARSSTKLGLSLLSGHAAYFAAGDLFVKSVPHQPGARYPDRGCNFECYADGAFLELETLSPLVTLAPGRSIVHRETWRLFADVPLPDDEGGIDHALSSRLPAAGRRAYLTNADRGSRQPSREQRKARRRVVPYGTARRSNAAMRSGVGCRTTGDICEIGSRLGS
jgi:hypothetical protein